EADSESTINISLSFFKALKHRNIQFLTAPDSYPPYFDAQFLIYSIGALLLGFIKDLHILNLEFLPTDQSLMIFTIRYTNVLMIILSCLFLFKILKSINYSNWISLIISLIFIFNPQTVEIDLMRIDHVILLSFMIVSYSTFAIINNPNLNRLSVTLGSSLAFLLNTKMNAFMFAYIPITTLAFLFFKKRYRIKNLCFFIVSFLGTYLLLLFRYLINFDSLITVLKNRSADLMLWYPLMSKEPYFYYNWDYFIKYGTFFILLFLLTLLTVLISLYKRFSIAEFIILTSLIVFSGLGIVSPKLDRWGIHFIPLYLWIINTGVDFWRYKFKKITDIKVLRAFLYLLITLVLLQPTLLLIENHGLILQTIEQRTISRKVTREEPREWFIKNAPPGTRVACYKIHSWANPPIFDLPLDFSSDILNYPYLKLEEIAVFMPPTQQQLQDSVDVVVLENLHRIDHIDTLQEPNLTKNLEAWKAFYKELDSNYKRIVFKSEYKNYGINEVIIYVISPKLLKRLE
ncbi:MAG TPA: hypothetical protein V6D48_16190, partial [Oculatellaceae cyanobacterium]